MKEGCVYILSNAQKTVLYTGVTSDLINRIYNHKQGRGSVFSSKYRTHFYCIMKVIKTCTKQSKERSESRSGKESGN